MLGNIQVYVPFIFNKAHNLFSMLEMSDAVGMWHFRHFHVQAPFNFVLNATLIAFTCEIILLLDLSTCILH